MNFLVCLMNEFLRRFFLHVQGGPLQLPIHLRGVEHLFIRFRPRPNRFWLQLGGGLYIGVGSIERLPSTGSRPRLERSTHALAAEIQ